MDNILIYKVKDDGKVSSRELLVSNSRKCIVGAKIYIRDRYFEDTNVLQTIIRKELGYTMGLDSSPDFTNLMSSNLDLTLQHPIDANEETINAIHSTYSK